MLWGIWNMKTTLGPSCEVLFVGLMLFGGSASLRAEDVAILCNIDGREQWRQVETCRGRILDRLEDLVDYIKCDQGDLIAGPGDQAGASLKEHPSCVYFTCEDHESRTAIRAQACLDDRPQMLKLDWTGGETPDPQNEGAACLGYLCVDATRGHDCVYLPVCLPPPDNLPPLTAIIPPERLPLEPDATGQVLLGWWAWDPDSIASVEISYWLLPGDNVHMLSEEETRRILSGHTARKSIRSENEYHGSAEWSWHPDLSAPGSYYIISSISDSPGRAPTEAIGSTPVLIRLDNCIRNMGQLVPRCESVPLVGDPVLIGGCLRFRCGSDPPMIAQACEIPGDRKHFDFQVTSEVEIPPDIGVCLDFGPSVLMHGREVACLTPRITKEEVFELPRCQSE